MKYDGVLFDLDGTLWDATEPIAKSWALALKDEPDIHRLPTLSEVEGVMGLTPDPLMKKLFPYLPRERRAELFDKCSDVENEYLRVHGGKLYDGVEETLRELSKKAPLCIVSNCNAGYIPAFLEAHRLEACFADWECVGRTGLDKWENIGLVARRNHMQAPLYVGDTALDKESADRAGVPFLHAAYGFGKVPGAEKIDSLKELLRLFP